MPYKETSSFIEFRLQAAGGRRRSRGAVFLEAAVVISALTFGLIALVYVRNLYVVQLGASRLSRAAVIAHSMAGCEGNQPRDWLARDVGDYTTQGANRDRQSARGGAAARGTNSPKARDLLQRSGATSSDGEGLLNPITQAEFGGQAKASGREGVSRSQTVFRGQVSARSFVSCGDEVKDGDFDRIMEVLQDEISNLFGR
ncbi:MAG TPA: hypothetical protein VJV79_03945 [Polyangiaceae bacterium]|nr:hypothetical protein [Polyangiaceae bacterium]